MILYWLSAVERREFLTVTNIATQSLMDIALIKKVANIHVLKTLIT